MIKLAIISIFVDDIPKAVEFYTSKLGFKIKRDIKEYNYVSLTDEFDNVELLLEPSINQISIQYQERLFASGIPATSFEVDDLDKIYNDLLSLGVEFSMKPTKMVGSNIAVFNDTCGNFIQIHQVHDE